MNRGRRDYDAARFQKNELQRPESLVEMGSVERRAPVSILPTLLPFDHFRLRITLQRDWEQIAETVQREESSNTRTHKAAAKHSCIGVPNRPQRDCCPDWQGSPVFGGDYSSVEYPCPTFFDFVC